MTALVSLVAFVVAGGLLAFAERRAPVRPRRRLREALARELAYVVFASALPAAAIGVLAARFEIAGPLGGAPFVAQWLAVLAITDVVYYAIHRAFHRVRWLWPLHHIHHSAAPLDWIAGFRKHVGEALVHGLVPLPVLAALAPSPAVMVWHAGIGIVATCFTHANLAARLDWLEGVIVTPRYHAWHHAIDEHAQGRNLAGKLTILDRLFGTRLDAPGWPAEIGLR